MRKPKLTAAAAVACAGAFALLVACKSPDGADISAGQRRAPGATNASGTTPTPYTNRPSPQGVDAHGHADTARRITVGELQQLIAKGEAVAVDVRSPEAYRQGHIKGAILMPAEEVKARAGELPKDKLLVFYCA